MKQHKVSVVGVGLGGKIHIPRIIQSNRFILDSLIAPPSGKNKKIADSWSVPLFESIEDCIIKREVDAIIIASPNEYHREHLTSCIRCEIPVLLEKPVSSSLEDARLMMNASANFQNKILIGHHRAHNPINKLTQEIVSSGELGRLVTFMGSAQFFKPDHYFEEGPWRIKPGGGPVLINMIHEVDNLRRVMGEIKNLQAIVSNNIRGYRVEDTAVINFQFTSGALGSFVLSDTVASSASWEQTSLENPGYPGYPNENCYLIGGTKGSLAIPTMQLTSYSNDVLPSWWSKFDKKRRLFNRLDPIAIQLDHFADVIEDKSPPKVTIKDGYKNMLIVNAIKNSASSGSLVGISDV